VHRRLQRRRMERNITRARALNHLAQAYPATRAPRQYPLIARHRWISLAIPAPPSMAPDNSMILSRSLPRLVTMRCSESTSFWIPITLSATSCEKCKSPVRRKDRWLRLRRFRPSINHKPRGRDEGRGSRKARRGAHSTIAGSLNGGPRRFDWPSGLVNIRDGVCSR